ncbi:MAG: CpaD family pilus assembly protein [Caulobacter sp.]|nr:CpaD family pilus assembly protein [Caulobacter sp.]
MPLSLIRLMSIAAALALTACATDSTTMAGPATPTVLDSWSSRVQVVAQPEEIRLAPHPTGLSGAQARALAEFQTRWMLADGGAITVAAPVGTDGPGAYRVSADARAFLVSQGAAPDMVQLVGYDAAGAKDAPVVVGFKRYVAITPRCGDWPQLTRTASNQPMSNLGCAVAANMAAQVANPGDLVAARPMDPADTGRRMTVLGKYRAGETTSSAKDEQASGAVSTVVQ